MTLLDNLFLFSILSFIVVVLIKKTALITIISPIIYAIMAVFLFQMSDLANVNTNEVIKLSVEYQVLGQTIHWRYDAVSWFFAVITIMSAFASAVFMSGDWGRQYREDIAKNTGGDGFAQYGLLQLVLLFNVVGMLLLLGSGDLLSLFIGWEVVSWASFWMMALSPTTLARKSAVKYLIYAMAGAMALLFALALVYSLTGSLQYQQVIQAFSQATAGYQLALAVLFAAAFAIKMGLLPFHLWQAIAYAETPGPGAAFLGAISARMGLYAIIVVLVQLAGQVSLESTSIFFNALNMKNILAWIAALTVIIPTYIALQQHDAKRLLAWHGIGQGGYMLLGIMMFDSIGSAGGLLHVFNYATYQAALFLTVVAVVYRTGTSNLNKLGGLVTQMPLTFLVMLLGIIGLAGLPPMNGFVSKWLVYRSLLVNGEPLLFVAAVIGTLGTILSVYKLIHNIFLGQLRVEHQKIKEVPWTMLVPMLALVIIAFITGLMPGLVLSWVASVQETIGLPIVPYILGGVEYEKGGLDMIWVCAILFYGFAVGAFLFYFMGGKSKRVHQYDNYAGGHFLSSEVRYHYSNNFYPGLMHLIGGWYRGSFKWFESVLVSLVSYVSLIFENLYRSRQPVVLLAAIVVIALFTLLYNLKGGSI